MPKRKYASPAPTPPEVLRLQLIQAKLKREGELDGVNEAQRAINEVYRVKALNRSPRPARNTLKF